MMKNETCPTDAGKLRSGTPRQQRRGLWSLATLTGLVLVAISGPVVWAKVSNTTGPINGTAPTATGSLSVMFPGGTTAVTNNATVSVTMKPADFGVSASGLVLQDADGDTGLSSSIDTAAVTWVWKYNNVALTAAQLAAPFSTNFLGKTLTVSASVPVTVSSLTGAPMTSGAQPLSSATYSLVVPASPPVVRVNGYSFAMNAGFPASGFTGANFQFWMDGTSAAGNNNYTFAADPLAPWVTVDLTTGLVTFASEPASRQTVTLNITDTRNGAVTTYSFIVKGWVRNYGSLLKTPPQAIAYCPTTGSGYSAGGVAYTNGTYGSGSTRGYVGVVLSEWGPLSSYPGGWPTNAYVPDGGQLNGNYTGVNLGSGLKYTGLLSGSNYPVVCSKSL